MNLPAEVTEAVCRLLEVPLSHGYQVAAIYPYIDSNGEGFYSARLEHETEEKIIRPVCRNGAGFHLGRPKRKPEGWPLYGVLSDKGPVFIVEGEKCVDTLAALGICAVTSGSATSADLADWSSLNDRDCVIWPDNDVAGAGYGVDVRARVISAGAKSVRTIDIQTLGLAAKGDCVDYLALHKSANANDLLALPSTTQVTRHDEENPARLFDEIHEYLGRFVAYPSIHAHVAHVLWIAHAHVVDAFESTPRIAFLSPEPGSGKSRALEVMEPLVPYPVEAVNVTPAYLFRKVGSDEGKPTILYDEIDTVFGPKAKDNEEIRGLLNAGHRKHAVAGRCVVRGKEVFTEEIPAYAAVALAGLGGLPDTIRSRAVIINMRRRAEHETIEPYRRRVVAPVAAALRKRLERWGSAALAELSNVWPEMPDGIHDRDADIWEALLAVADAAGEHWPGLARVAAVALVAESRQSTPTLGVQLLADLRRIFGDREVMSTEQIITALLALEESPWDDLRGKALDARGLSWRLKPYGVAPQTVRIGYSTPKGYRRTDLHDAWARYLPASPAESATTATAATPTDDVADVLDVAEQDDMETSR